MGMAQGALPLKGDHPAQPVLLVVLAEPALPGPVRLHRRAADGSPGPAESGAAVSAGGRRSSAARPGIYGCPVVGHDAAGRDGSFLGRVSAQRTTNGAIGVVVAADQLKITRAKAPKTHGGRQGASNSVGVRHILCISEGNIWLVPMRQPLL